MESTECYLECAKIASTFKDENGNFKILTNRLAGFKIKILKIFPKENDKLKDDYLVTFKLENLTSKEIKYADLNAINHHYV
jgi:hypothetical protein